ncbi:FAD-dependent oxidoreductase, partial [Escherichia coli]
AAVKVDSQAEFHPRKYLLALAEAFTAAGGRIFEETAATGLSWSGPPTVKTDGERKVEADHVVVTTLMPLFDRGLWFPRLTPKSSYA